VRAFPFRLRTAERPVDRGLDQAGQVDFRLDVDARAGELRVAAFLAAEFARLLHQGEAAARRRVVAEDVERVLAGVEPAVADLQLAGVFVALADRVLKVAALEIGTEALVGNDGGLRLGRSLGGHGVSSDGSSGCSGWGCAATSRQWTSPSSVSSW
jgi:hypothetical protein